MEIQVNDLEYCKVQIQCRTGLEDIETQRNAVLDEMKDVKVSGFRPGKATNEILKIRFKKQIDESVKQRLAQFAFEKAISEQKITPLGNPKFTSLELKNDSFECEFLLQKKPEFELKQYKEFEIPKFPAPISAGDMAEKILHQLRVQHAEALPYQDSDFIQVGDSIIADYETFIDGDIQSELSGNNQLLLVGEAPLPAFDDNILGMKMGDTREFDIAVPEQVTEKYSGKTLHFKFTLKMGSKKNLPPLDDSLAVKVGLASFDDLREKALGIAGLKVEEYRKNYNHQQVADRLVQNHDFKIPDWLVTTEAQFKARADKTNKLDWESITDDQKEKLLSDSEKSIKLTFILDKVRELEIDAQMTDEEVFAQIQQNVETVVKEHPEKTDVDKILSNLKERGVLQVLKGQIRDQYTLTHLVSTCKTLD